MKQNKPTLGLEKYKKILIWLAAITSIYIVSMFLPVIGGYTSYPIAVARCGKLPVITSTFAASYSYVEPGASGYDGPSIVSSYEDYVCTAAEAESQGFHKSPF